SATLNYPSPDCNRIRYAGLYWSATYPSELASEAVGTNRRTDFNRVKLKVLGGNYVDITGEALYDGYNSTETDMKSNSPYVCYADVVTLLTTLSNVEVLYTLENVRSELGVLSGGKGGASVTWSFVIVYKNAAS